MTDPLVPRTCQGGAQSFGGQMRRMLRIDTQHGHRPQETHQSIRTSLHSVQFVKVVKNGPQVALCYISIRKIRAAEQTRFRPTWSQLVGSTNGRRMRSAQSPWPGRSSSAARADWRRRCEADGANRRRGLLLFFFFHGQNVPLVARYFSFFSSSNKFFIRPDPHRRTC